jgi:HAD superfamily hydrolase (TIGR01509 family)
MSGVVIFDCDGVLVDSEPIAVRVDLEMLADLGWEMSEAEAIDRFVGRSPEVMQQAIEQRLGHAPDEDWEQRFEQLRWRRFEAELTAVDGVKEALAQITAPVCVASSSQPASLRRKLELTGLYSRFAGRMFSASEVAHGKPAPDLFLYAAEKMGVDPSNCVVVEDSRYGVEAGRAAGMDVLAYAGGVTAADVLEGPRTTVFDDMRRLPALLGDRANGTPP